MTTQPLSAPGDLDADSVVTPAGGVELHDVAGEPVILDGWRQASVASVPAAMIWERLDGRATLGDIAAQISVLVDADRSTVLHDVVEFAQQVARLGYLADVDPHGDDPDPQITLVPLPVPTDAGDVIDDLSTVDPDGVESRILGFQGRSCLLVNWSPHCGYCASILGDLATLDGRLRDAGVDLVLFAYGSADSSRTQAELSGWHPRVLLKPAHEVGPFTAHGTPAAFHIDATGTLLDPAARGTTEVVDLAARLAGAGPAISTGSAAISPGGGTTGGEVRYVLDRGGSCSPGTGSEPVTRWVGTRVYRIDGHHVGFRCVTDETVEILDALFRHRTVDDPRAGHIFTVAVSEPGGSDGEASNLLCLGSDVLVRSRSPERVLRALLWHLGEWMHEPDPTSSLVRVRATAVRVPGGIALLHPGLHGLEERLQPAFARYGIAYVDVAHPEVDFERAEVVVPEPALPHDPAVIAAAGPSEGWPDEPAPVRPGRYPLVGWGSMSDAEQAVTRFTPAQAAAAVVSNVTGTGDAAAGLRRLALLFQRVPGFGLSYHSEAGLADAVAEALRLDAVDLRI